MQAHRVVVGMVHAVTAQRPHEDDNGEEPGLCWTEQRPGQGGQGGGAGQPGGEERCCPLCSWCSFGCGLLSVLSLQHSVLELPDLEDAFSPVGLEPVTCTALLLEL